MMFEYDSNKSRANKQKHGINFEEAKAIWSDPERLEIPTKEIDEQRCLVIGIVDGKHWSAIITYRGQNIRMISVRRSRSEEITLYESI